MTTWMNFIAYSPHSNPLPISLVNSVPESASNSVTHKPPASRLLIKLAGNNTILSNNISIDALYKFVVMYKVENVSNQYLSQIVTKGKTIMFPEIDVNHKEFTDTELRNILYYLI